MAIRGSLREASLPDVLQLLAMGKKSGCLSVTHRHAFGSVYFDRGRISFASIVNRRDRLGDMLVAGGIISREDLDDAIAIQSAQPQRRLGEILIANNLLAREELHAHIKRQIEEAVYYLFTWTQGTFSFEPDVVPDEQDFLVSINPESLLLEGARRIAPEAEAPLSELRLVVQGERIVVEQDGAVRGVVNPGRQNAPIRRGHFDATSGAVELEGEHVTLDGAPLTLGLTSSTFPELPALRRGEGVIRLQVSATHPSLSAGAHQLFFRNRHLAGQSVYLANALAPEEARISVTEQRRDPYQRELTIGYAIARGSASLAGWMVISLPVAAFLIVRFTRRNWLLSGR